MRALTFVVPVRARGSVPARPCSCAKRKSAILFDADDLIKDGSLICEGFEGGTRLRRLRLSDEDGPGLFLVAELTKRWGTHCTISGKTAWAEQPLEGD